uniref:Putative ovule protein n=1 Tax=Solanum chacoense TaxID=4108 RepID=A0A0V0H4P9_SOLCH
MALVILLPFVLSEGNLDTLKSPQITQGPSHIPLIAESSHHNSSLSFLSHSAYTAVRYQVRSWLTQIVYK